jgi:Tfp pilus assembly protein PilX
MTHQKQSQQGFVSIIVSVIIMVILSLVTIGFAQLMSREQRQALDRQLSTQAFYAAESGVNDARINLASYTSTCPATEALDSDRKVLVTCVTVNQTPTEVKKDQVDQKPFVFPLNLTDDSGAKTAPTSVIVKWSSPAVAGRTDFRPDAAVPVTWPSMADWAYNTGVAKVAIIPFKDGDSRATLIANEAIGIFNPALAGSSPGTVALPSLQGNNQYTIVNGNCSDATHNCTITIDTSALTIASYDELYMVISSLYTSSNFVVSSPPLVFNDVQAVIDSTGRTNDVLRRIQVRAPLVPTFTYSSAALTSFGSGPSDGICKLLRASQDAVDNGCPL